MIFIFIDPGSGIGGETTKATVFDLDQGRITNHKYLSGSFKEQAEELIPIVVEERATQVVVDTTGFGAALHDWLSIKMKQASLEISLNGKIDYN